MAEKSCPVCLGQEIEGYLHLKSNDLRAVRCKRCGHVFIANSPITAQNVSQYYTLEDFKGARKLQDERWYVDYYRECFVDYEKYLDSSGVLKQFEEKLAYLGRQFPNKGRLLDVGCATGVFLDMARKRGWSVQGVEVSPELAAYARENFSLQVHEMDLTWERGVDGPFDVVTLFDVIEHVPAPNALIKACRQLLSDGGLLLVRTPAEEGLLRNIAKLIYGLSLKKYEVPLLWFYSFEHIQSFSLATLSSAFRANGFSIKKVFREEESLDRLAVPGYVKAAIRGINMVSRVLSMEHKMCVVGKKETAGNTFSGIACAHEKRLHLSQDNVTWVDRRVRWRRRAKARG